MRILLLLSESWNDLQAPNNNMTNWLSDFPDAEIWTISGSSQLPHNSCSKHYFMIGETAMMKSLVSRQKVGNTMHLEEYPQNTPTSSGTHNSSKLFSNEFFRLARDIVWRYGRYDVEQLRKFVEDCQPDIVFSQRRGSIKMCRMERLVASMTSAPMVAYTGDDEYSLHQFSLSPLFWIRRLWVRSALKKRIPQYRLFYCQSERQMQEFRDEFGVETKFLVKCGRFDREKVHTQVHDPIRIIYAGKLYCNRWKTLAMLAKAIAQVNEQYACPAVTLHIYTRDVISKKQNRLLNDGVHAIIHGPVSGDQIPEIYRNGDIALHVEAFDRKNRLLTQDSFSTKAMDCLSSGCATMVISWEGHAAYRYFLKQDAAITAASYDEVRQRLETIVQERTLVLTYAHRAYELGIQAHQHGTVREQLRNDFCKVIDQW